MKLDEIKKFIEEYSQKIEEKFGKYDDKEKLILSSTVKLTEELGELCDEVMTYNSRQRSEKVAKRDKDNLPREFADVLLAVFMLAKDMDVDLETAVKEKIEIIKTKYEIYD